MVSCSHIYCNTLQLALHTAAIRTDEFNMNSGGMRFSFKATRLKWNTSSTNLISQSVGVCGRGHITVRKQQKQGSADGRNTKYQMEWTKHVD
jgi:hypothetical protein